MSFIVDHLFPMWREDAADEFSSFAYWREPIFEVPMLEATEAEKPTTQWICPSVYERNTGGATTIVDPCKGLLTRLSF